jgi:hypothetical protein
VAGADEPTKPPVRNSTDQIEKQIETISKFKPRENNKIQKS